MNSTVLEVYQRIYISVTYYVEVHNEFLVIFLFSKFS